MKYIFAILLVLFLAIPLPAAANWEGTANFYDESPPYSAKMRTGQLLSFGNPISFTYQKKNAGPTVLYEGIVQAISIGGTQRIQIHIFFSKGDAKKAEGELNLEWREQRKKSSAWWKFWE